MKLCIRPGGGLTAIEIAIGSLVIGLIAITAVDLTILTLGYNLNDAACRDAARASGMADSAQSALTAAKVACAAHHTDGYLVSQPIVDQSTFRFGASGQSSEPCVEVTTLCSQRINILSMLNPSKLPNVATRRQYVFPALALIEKPPVVETVDLAAFIGPDTVSIPATSTLAYGSSQVQGSSE